MRLNLSLSIKLFSLIIIGMALALAACSFVWLRPAPAEMPAPSIEILIPGDDRTYQEGIGGDTGQILVYVRVTNFNLIYEQGRPNAPGEGHIHYFMNVDPPTEPGKPAITPDGTFVDTADTAYFWDNPGFGTHTFSVELVNNDHTPLNPPVIDRTTLCIDDFYDK